MTKDELYDSLQTAVDSFWSTRQGNADRSAASGKTGEGTRGAVRGGGQLLPLAQIIARAIVDTGYEENEVLVTGATELPGYFRPEKKWDLLAFVGKEKNKKQLVAAIECKSQIGSFGKNFNNRAEESIGNAVDSWRSFREGLYSEYTKTEPFLGYIFILEDHDRARRPVRNKQTHYSVDPEFVGNGGGLSYTDRYKVLLQRLVRERAYSSACLITSGDPEKDVSTKVHEPSEHLSFESFVAKLQGTAIAARGLFESRSRRRE